MENFKKALKQGILEKAEAVRFEESLCPQLLLYSAERALIQLQVFNRGELLTLINTLIPTPPNQQSLVREGVLSIVNFGEIQLLATTGDIARLFAFIPPQGNQIYQQIRNQILYQGTQSVVKPVDMMEESIAVSDIDQPGNFSMGPTTNQNPIKQVEEEAFDGHLMDSGSPDLSPPPLPIRAEKKEFPDDFQTLARPGNRAPIPVNFVGDADDGISASGLLGSNGSEPRQTTVISNRKSSAFKVDEHSEDEDYHFNQANYSLQKDNQEFANTRVTNNTSPPMPPTSPSQILPVAPKANEASKPSPEHTIHFGPTIPGETITRRGSFPIDSILEEIVRKKASDLHLTQAEPMCMRLDGNIVRMGEVPLTQVQMQNYLLPIMPPKNREEFASQHDTDFAYEIPGLARFRVNVFRDRMGVGAVLRQIPDKVLSADDLGLPVAVRKLCELQKGLVVVTGPTGSGKSTTLAAMIDLINETRTDHILTIEDPIEFVHKQKRCLLNQREVHKHTQSFARALRAALREDPDIILIGEMRDLETVAIAIETAETGHLVFGTLHTNTAISTVDRLIDQFPPAQQEQIRVMLSESLKGVVAQTLVKKKGGGRVAAQEILIVDKAVSSMVREGNTHMVQNHMQTQKAKGNCTLNDALITLVTKGLIEAKDAYLKAIDKEAFLVILQQKGIAFDAGVKTAS